MEYGSSKEGPLLIVIAAIHGNELAGVKALRLVSKMLEVEPITNPNFSFNGKIVGLIGNKKASLQGVRYIDEDLNRLWRSEVVDKIKTSEELSEEKRELSELLSVIMTYVSQYRHRDIFILDLHTTSSDGGIFSIPNDDPRSLSVAQNLHAPVILDMLSGIQGTTLHYFNYRNFPNDSITAVTFEAGQHEDPASVNRCIAAIVNCLRSIGCVKHKDVENIHDNLLISYSIDLPPLSRLLYKKEISVGDGFKMKLGYKNFDKVKSGEMVATDQNGPIFCPFDGLILMPLYQDQGQEGFYVVESVSDNLDSRCSNT